MPFKHTTTDRYRPDPPHGRLAQLVERMTVNHDGVSSKLTFPAIDVEWGVFKTSSFPWLPLMP